MGSSKALDGKIAIVTGSSRGIGRAIALRLAQEGATVVLAARSEPELAKAASEIKSSGGKASFINRDLRDPAAALAVVDAALNAHGTIDIVVNNAGATKHGDFFELSVDAETAAQVRPAQITLPTAAASNAKSSHAELMKRFHSMMARSSLRNAASFTELAYLVESELCAGPTNATLGRPRERISVASNRNLQSGSAG